jgi:hypothetical protein
MVKIKGDKRPNLRDKILSGWRLNLARSGNVIGLWVFDHSSQTL